MRALARARGRNAGAPVGTKPVGKPKANTMGRHFGEIQLAIEVPHISSCILLFLVILVEELWNDKDGQADDILEVMTMRFGCGPLGTRMTQTSH